MQDRAGEASGEVEGSLAPPAAIPDGGDLMADFHQVELPPAGDGVERFDRLARRYVLELGAHDLFTVVGRVRGATTREIDWWPGQGATALRRLVSDYQEYFEAIHFPPTDARALPEPAEVYATGVGLRVLNVRGGEAARERVAALAEGLDGFDEDAVAYASPARAREMTLVRAAWKSHADLVEALAPALADPEESVVMAAIRLVGRFRLKKQGAALVERLGDARAPVRRAAVAALASLGDTTALPHLVDALHDVDEDVCVAAVEALGTDRMRTALRHDPARLRRVMERLAAYGL